MDASHSFVHCELHEVVNVADVNYDSVCLVISTLDSIPKSNPCYDALSGYLKINPKALDTCGVALIGCAKLAGHRLVLSSTGHVTKDYDDVRTFDEAAQAAIKKAISIGSRCPILVSFGHSRFPNAQLVTILGALQSAYVPLEIRDISKERSRKIDKLGVWSEVAGNAKENITLAIGMEAGRCVARDIAASDPERMSPMKTADYIKQAFGQKGCAVHIKIIDDQSFIQKEYPMMAAVNRAANSVDRHKARLIWLEYSNGTPEETIMLVGKGVTLDTGGTDVKINGGMYGMSRDKSGAAAVGGIFKALDVLRPKNVKFVGFMCMVRNSIGEEAYTCDEIITARSGKRVRIVNTDAEGRVTMLDPLCHMKEMAVKEHNPHIYTIATLTGHAYLTVGAGYSILMDNGPAMKENSCFQLQKSADTVGDMVEISTFRREDYRFHQGQSEYSDLRQANTQPSSRTERGHQGPGAFMVMGSGLEDHGTDSNAPLKYTHIDMAGNEGHFPGVPPGSPVAALAARYIIPRI